MGDVADMMLDGTLCEGCGVFLNEDPPGYPCRCSSCGGEPYVKGSFKREAKERETKVLTDRKVPFTSANNGECLVIRIKGVSDIDFYPSTGRWRDKDAKKTMSGGAKALIHYINCNALHNRH